MPYAVRGKFVDGKVVFEAPPDWPEGLHLRLEPIGPPDEYPDHGDESPAAGIDERAGSKPQTVAAG